MRQSRRARFPCLTKGQSSGARPLHAGGQARHDIADSTDGLVSRLAIDQRLAHRIDQHGAHHDAIGMPPDFGGVFGSLDAKADSDGQVGMSLDCLLYTSPSPRDS